jgi:hypothetical protein
MVLVMARWEAGLHELRPKATKGELENNSRKEAWDITKNRRS